jgi:2-acetylphloroglucinol acetyltransferase
VSGILSYGTAIPRRRIDARTIRAVWGNVAESFIDMLSIGERAVLGPDEDTLTLAVSAARACLQRAGGAADIGALLLGSGTSPYATKAAADVLKDALDLPPDVLACDVQCAERSGSTALALARGLVESGVVKRALVVAADTPNRHTAPGQVVEYVAGAGACAVLVGAEPGIAELGRWKTHSWDQSDYFRLEGDRFIRSGAGFYGWVANWGLLDHVVPAVTSYFEATGTQPADYTKFVVPQKTGVRALMTMGKSGLDMMQVLPYVLTQMIGDAGAAQSFLALAHILDWADPGERIGVVDYGSGAGCDVWSLKATPALETWRPATGKVLEQIEDKVMVDYATMLKLEHKMLRPTEQLANFY